MDFSDKLVLIVAFLSLLVLFIGVFFLPATPRAAEPNATENSTAPEQQEPQEEPKTDVWSLLNRENVEIQCLRQARAFAAEQGLPSFFVSRCSCSEEASPSLKSYNCTISAIDGTYNIDAKCVNADKRCIFTSLGGTIVYTFDEMEKLMID